MRIGIHRQRNIVNDLQTVTDQSHSFFGIVGQQAQLGYTQVPEDLRAYTIITLVGLKAQVQVGLYGIHSFFLQFVGPEFIHQTDASALLVHI